MWLFRKKNRTHKPAPEPPTPAATPMRRIEITYERHAISRITSNSHSTNTTAAHTNDMPDAPVPELARPAHLLALVPKPPQPHHPPSPATPRKESHL